MLLAALGVAVALGLYRAIVDGRFGGTRRVRGTGAGTAAPEPTVSVLAETAYAAHLGERATLVQFSSAFCAPCRATRQVLSSVADQVPGVRHVEIDAEQHLELVRRLGVLRTPTTLVLDGAGRETGRAAGAPRREQVLTALAGALG